MIRQGGRRAEKLFEAVKRFKDGHERQTRKNGPKKIQLGRDKNRKIMWEKKKENAARYQPIRYSGKIKSRRKTIKRHRQGRKGGLVYSAKKTITFQGKFIPTMGKGKLTKGEKTKSLLMREEVGATENRGGDRNSHPTSTAKRKKRTLKGG